jgi:hypothetical protein
VSVPTVVFSELLAEHGLPHYLKIDIEGNDRFCVEALRGSKVPQFISVESECTGDTTVLSDEEAIAMLDLLREVGYQRFKLVKQGGWVPNGPNGAANFYRQLVQSFAQGHLSKIGLSKIAGRFTTQGKIAAESGFALRYGSSGPWGEDVRCDWMTYDQAKTLYLSKRHSYFSKSRALYSFWYDWHAAC